MMQRLQAVNQEFLDNLNLIQRRMAATQGQISSGVRVSQPSDDPSAVNDILQLEFNSSKIAQTIKNFQSAQGELGAADSALQNVSSLLSQAGSIGAQGATGTATAAGRLDLAGQIQSILDQVVTLSNSTYQGQYLFGGDQPASAPYELNLSSATGVNQLQSAPATKVVQDFNGNTFSIARTAQEIFDHRDSSNNPDASNVFASLNNLRLALQNNDQTAIVSALNNLNTAQTYFETQTTFYGETESRIQNALTSATQLQTQTTTSLTQVRDTDVAAAATQLSQDNLSQQAAIQSEASMPRGSLFDYLK